MTDFQTKTISDFSIKSIDRGEVVAVVSTTDHVDRDGDVILSGAIKDGSAVKLSAYEHDVITEGKPPVGQGVVNIQGNQAVLSARYYLTTERGRDAFNTVKEMGASSEWSIGFSKNVKTSPMTDAWKAKGARRLIAGLQLYEASPVFMGANGMTATVSAKAASSEDDAVEAARQAELQRIYREHVVPYELRTNLASLKASYRESEAIGEESALAGIMLRTLEREATRPDSYSAPSEFDRVAEFARDSLGLDWRALPAPRLVRVGTLNNAEGKRLRGAFLVVKNSPRIFLEDTGDTDGMIKTFLHESSHARQHHYGDPMTERDACEQAAMLFSAWQRHEADER